MSPSSTTQSSVSQVRVAVRARPLSSTEQSRGGKEYVNVSSRNRTVCLGNNETGKCFTYDSVYDTSVSQNDLYDDISRPLLSSFLEGYNATILAYGQTGSGKTYTMGSEDHHNDDFDAESRGLLPRFMEDIFQSMESNESDDKKSLDITVSASFLEVYGDDVFDLLDESEERKSLAIREDTSGEVVVSGLKAIPVSNVKEAMNILNQGTMNRTTASTLMNSTSSRSHAVFTVTMVKTESSSADVMNMTSSCRMTFVDLAGSERMKKTGAVGDRAKEGIKINEGLLALGNVINALADDARLAKGDKIFVPYRQSKLTRLLQGALGGNSQTLFLACVSPSDTNANETLSTLQYANRARNIKNTLKKNVDPAVIEMQRLHALTNVLQRELVKHVFEKDGTEDQDASSNSSYQDLLLRAEVQEFIQKLHEQAEEKCQEKMSSGFKVPQKSNTYAVNSHKVMRKNDDHGTVESKDTGKRSRKSDDNNSVESAKSMEVEMTTGLYDDLNESFQDLNPDNDIAMLDHLLQLQRKDQEFDDNERVELEDIEKVDGELQEQESILLQLKESIKTYHNIKEKYDELMTEVSQLEKEKARLADELENALNDPTKGCSQTIKKKLGGVESSLERARNEARQHEALCRKIDKEVNKCRELEQKIVDLKRGKAEMIRRQKEAAAKHRDYTEEKTREINALKKKERKTGMEVLRLERENKRHQAALERRKQSQDKLASKLKQTEDRLMNYLKIKKRVLNNRSNDRISTPENSEFAPMSENVKSTKFLIDRAMVDRVKEQQLTESYKTKMAEYGDYMELLVKKVKMLDQFKHMNKCKVRQKDILEIEQSIQSIEDNLERIGSELDDLREKLPGQDNEKVESDKEKGKETKLIQTISKLSGPIARTLLLEFLNDVTKSKCNRAILEDTLKRKESIIKELSQGMRAFNQSSNNLEDKVNIARSDKEIAYLKRKLLEKENDLHKSNQAFDELKRELVESKEKIKELEAKKKRKKKAASDDDEEVDMTVFDAEDDDLDLEEGNDSDWNPTPAKPKRNRADKNKRQLDSSIIMKSLMHDDSMMVGNDEFAVENSNDAHLEGLDIIDKHQALIHLDTLRVSELKDLLRQRELPLYGKKEELLLRLRKSIYEEQTKLEKSRISIGSANNDGRHVSFADLPEKYSPIMKNSPHNTNKSRISIGSASNDGRHVSFPDLPEKYSPIMKNSPHNTNKDVFLDLHPSTDFENEDAEEFSHKNKSNKEDTVINGIDEFSSNEKKISVNKTRDSDISDVSKSTNGEANDEIFVQSSRPTIINKKTASPEVKHTENLDALMDEVSPSSTNASNDKYFFDSLRSGSTEKKKHEDKMNSEKINKKSNPEGKHFSHGVNGSTNKENEDIFLQSLRSSSNSKNGPKVEVKKKSPRNDESKRDVPKLESKKRSHVDGNEQNLPRYRKPLESKGLKRRDESNTSMTYEDNNKAFFDSLRSNCQQGTSSQSTKRKTAVDAGSDRGFKRRKQILNLDKNLSKQIDETEKLLEEL